VGGRRPEPDSTSTVVSVTEKLPRSGVNKTFSAITSALKQDVSVLELFDEHDPLGLAFYIYAIVESNYVSIETNELAEAGRLWALEKLTGTTSLSVYKDRDVAAIALIVYTFRHRPSDVGAAKLADFVRPFIDSIGSVFSNFFCSALVGLALRQTDATDDVTRAVTDYLDQQLSNCYSVVANDAKNILMAYWWARDTKQQAVLEKLNLSAKDIVADVQPSLDALVIASYVLLDQAELFSRKERRPIKAAVENALTAIEAYTHESLSPAVALAYDRDTATLPDELRRPGLEGKPRVSRILLAIALMLQRSYLQKSGSLLSSKERGLQISRAVLSATGLLLLLWFVFWLAERIGFPFDVKAALRSRNGIEILRGIGLIAANTATATFMLVIIFWMWRFVFDLGVVGRCRDEWEVLSFGWDSLAKNFWIAIILPLLISVLVALMT
jgi:hypothetical protein